MQSRFHDARTNARFGLLGAGIRRQRNEHIYMSGRRQEAMQHGLIARGVIVIDVTLAIEAVAKLAKRVWSAG